MLYMVSIGDGEGLERASFVLPDTDIITNKD
jgi:hypothetical protein